MTALLALLLSPLASAADLVIPVEQLADHDIAVEDIGEDTIAVNINQNHRVLSLRYDEDGNAHAVIGELDDMVAVNINQNHRTVGEDGGAMVIINNDYVIINNDY